jgi:ATP-dependent protease ClpP protease subunit
MKTNNHTEEPAQEKILSPLPANLLKPLVRADNSVDYLGAVSYAMNERVFMRIRELTFRKAKDSIFLSVTSPGGQTGTAMSFFDQIRYVLKPNLVTIGAGDVDSAGLIIFLAGEKRYITKHTTVLLHLAGRIFEADHRFTADEISCMGREDRIKDSQYAELVASRSKGKLTSKHVLKLMAQNTILNPYQMVEKGLADGVLE